MKKNLQVGILGAGNWGTVLALLASRKCSSVFLYDREEIRAHRIQKSRENLDYLPGILLPSNVEITSSLKTVFENTPLILPVVPSVVFRSFAKEFAPYTRGDHVLVHGTKGLEPDSFKRMSEILTEETSALRVGALSGPNLATELAAQKPGATTVASRFSEVIELVQECFSSEIFRVYGNHDLSGVEWAGSLKNILAVGAGILSELKLGQNALAMFLTRGMYEIRRIMASVGSHADTLNGLAGIGDIIATCTSSLSRNFRAGELIARGVSDSEIQTQIKMTIEGLATIKVARSIGMRYHLDTPIIEALHRIAIEKEDPLKTIFELMNRPQGTDVEEFGIQKQN